MTCSSCGKELGTDRDCLKCTEHRRGQQDRMEFDEDGRFIGFKPKEQIKSIEQECREIEEKEEEVSTFVEDIFISLKYGVFCGYLTQAGIRFSKDISLLGYGDNDNGYDPEPQYA